MSAQMKSWGIRMADIRNKLKAKFEQNNRSANFGEALIRMRVKGFRCHTNTVVDIRSPITAFCGLNGTGKSTLLQLIAVAYKRTAPARPYYVKDFLVVGKLDPNPFTDDAEVEYTYLKGPSAKQIVTVSRRAATQRWIGYTRRPEREVYFAGIGHYLPRIELRDFVVRNAKHLEISGTDHLSEVIREAAARILGCKYAEAKSKLVNYSGHKGQIVSVQRGAVEYSETHMGFGEGRTLNLLATLEKLPDKSLVLIEEPETSLHPSAQHELARYLMEVCCRKGHQIFLTTHSEYLLNALPSESRIYLQRKADGSIRCLPGLTAAEARSLMTSGKTKSLTVLVEDECAKAVLREILRRADGAFLSTVGIAIGGDANAIKSTVSSLKETGLSVAAVRDGDQVEIPAENIFKLPGTKPPEKELLENQVVKEHVANTYDESVEDFLAAMGDVDHHDWLDRLAERINIDPQSLLGELARIYARALPESEVVKLKDLLKESING